MSVSPFVGASVIAIFLSYMFIYLVLELPIVYYTISKRLVVRATIEHSFICIFYSLDIGVIVVLYYARGGESYLQVDNFATFNAICSFLFFALPFPLWYATLESRWKRRQVKKATQDAFNRAAKPTNGKQRRLNDFTFEKEESASEDIEVEDKIPLKSGKEDHVVFQVQADGFFPPTPSSSTSAKDRLGLVFDKLS